LTHGGNRMLRANMLQPLSNEQAIKSRYDLVQVLLDDRTLFDILSKELIKFRNFEIITAKFIQNPKEKNIKSLKTYLSAIYSISHMCLLLKNLYKKIEQYIPKKLPVINKLFVLLNDPKIGQLKDNI
jgi:DNA mismatch repair ATPase MutS